MINGYRRFNSYSHSRLAHYHKKSTVTSRDIEIGCKLLLRDWELGRHATFKGTKLFTKYNESSYLPIIGRCDNVKVKDVKAAETEMVVNQATLMSVTTGAACKQHEVSCYMIKYCLLVTH